MLRESVISALHALLGIYTTQNNFGCNQERLIRSLAEAPVTTSKRACIINTKEETFSIRDEDQKANETITCQRVALGGEGAGGCTHRLPQTSRERPDKNENGPSWRGKLVRRGNFFFFASDLSWRSGFPKLPGLLFQQ